MRYRNKLLWEDSRQREYRAAKARFFRLATILAALLAATAALALSHL